MAVMNYDALITALNQEQTKQEQAAREANALLERQAAAKRDQLMNTYAAQESNQRRNYGTLVDQADTQLTKDGSAAYQSMLVARNPFGTNAERLRNNGMSEYMNTAAYNTYRGDYNNAKNTRDTNVKNYNLALENYLSELNANRANAGKDYDIALLNAQNQLQQQLATLQAQYGQQRLQYEQAKQQAAAQAAAARRRSRGGGGGNGGLDDLVTREDLEAAYKRDTGSSPGYTPQEFSTRKGAGSSRLARYDTYEDYLRGSYTKKMAAKRR